MAPTESSRKRKAVTRDVDEVQDVASGDELEEGIFDRILSQSDDESEDDNAEDESELDEEEDEEDGLDEGSEDESVPELESDEIPSEGEDAEPSKIRKGGQNSVPKKVSNGEVVDGGLVRVNGDSTLANADLEDAPSEDAALGEGVPSDDESRPNYTVTTDANGNPRYIYKEIEPVYDSDDSDAPAAANTIGNIPLSFYDSYPHIGYDINGKKILRPAKGEALDALLDQIELPKGWTGLTDPATGKPLQLSQEELEVLKRIQMNEVPEEGYNPYEPTIEYFTSITEQMPLSSAPEPKRRFIPSKHEAKRVMKIVKAIREGRILPYKPPTEEEDERHFTYDIWANEAPRPDHPMNIPAPKLPPPGYEESYHPPPEYLPTREEKKAWEQADEEDKQKQFLPRDHEALRKVPGYDQFVKEKFERCLDLYLAPRVRRSKLNIDPESLLPKLPSPEELRPFPTTCATIFRGHQGRVRSLSIDPSGIWLASGGDDGTVRVWELLTGREVWSVQLVNDEPINVVRWRPGKDAFVLCAAAGESFYLMIPPLVDPELETRSREILDAGWGYASTASQNTSAPKKDAPAMWSRPGMRLEEQNVLIKATLRSTIKVISWHRRGDYFATVSPAGQTSAIAIHTVSKHLTQLPFRRLKGLPQTAQFHPSKPIFFVATQRTIRSYDLQAQSLLKILQPGARWISSLDVHPGGDNLIVGTYDRRLLWHDLDLSNKPYKTLRYHQKAIRAVRFHHGGHPLFADASDDGSLQVFHGKVVGDALENATIVPLKVLRGHEVRNGLGVLDLEWHPREPWLVSAAADGTCRLWM